MSCTSSSCCPAPTAPPPPPHRDHDDKDDNIRQANEQQLEKSNSTQQQQLAPTPPQKSRRKITIVDNNEVASKLDHKPAGDLAAKLTRPPWRHQQQRQDEPNLDSGYAWLILLVMFLLNSTIGGSSRVYGLVYANQVAIGYYDREEASWPIASASAVENLAGILTPALATCLSWRQIELLSTLLLVAANLGAYFSSSLGMDFLCLGIIQGLALSMSTVLSLAINNEYFERYRTSAYGIAMSGSAFGVLYLVPMVSWLLQSYGDFRLVYLALALVFMLNIVLVLFIKPRKRPQDDQLRPETANGYADHESAVGGRNKLQASRKTSILEHHLERKSSVASVSMECRVNRQSTWRSQRRWQTTYNKQHVAPVHQTGNGAPPARKSVSLMGPASSPFKSQVAAQLAQQQAQAWRSASGLEAKQEPAQVASALAGSENNVSQAGAPEATIDTRLGKSSPDLQTQNHDTSGMAANGDSRRAPEVDGCVATRPEVGPSRQGGGGGGDLKAPQGRQAPSRRQSEQRFSLGNVAALLRLPYLHCVWMMLTLYYLISRVFIIILVDFADDHGLEPDESRQLLNYWSLGELTGRIVLGSLIDLQWISVRVCIALTCSILASAILTMVLVESFVVYAICSTLVAALASLEYMLINVLMIEYMGKSQVTSCYSLAAFISSLLLFGRPTLIGLFRDQLGSYDGLLMLLAGVTFAYALLFFLLEPLLVRFWPKCRSRA